MSVRCLSCLKTVEGPVCPHCGYPETVTTLSHQLPVGTVLRERYQIGRVLGQGGFGITYLAWDALLQKSVAIKEFFPGGTVQRNCAVTTQVECIYTSAAEAYNRSTERFLREAQALVQFRDIPQVVDIQDFLRENNTAYIVMEFVKGVDLAKYIQAKGGRLTPEETFRILKPVMEALAKVHKGGIVHRDISPDNIVLDPLGGAKLLDFGAVRAVENPDAEKALDKSTEAILKHGFAPIEQYNTRGSLGPWTDVYAMCATVWYCLTGRIPEEASIRITEGSDPDWASIPGLTPAQQAALAKGSACRPRDRYPDMDSLLAGLFQEAAPQFPKTVAIPTKAPQEKPEEVKGSAIEEEKKPKGKKKLWPIAVAAAAVAVAAIVLVPRLPAMRYSKAEALMESGSYEQAAAIYNDLGSHSDSRQKAHLARYLLAKGLMEQGSYEEAAAAFSQLDDYSDSSAQANRCTYLQGKELLSQGQYDEAERVFTALGTYEDSPRLLQQCRCERDYPKAMALLEQEDYAGAAALFETMGDYLDSRENLALCSNTLDYQTALRHQAEGRYFDAAKLFYSLGDFADARNLCFACWEKIAVRKTLVSTSYSAAALHTDGTVTTVGLFMDNVTAQTATWRDIVSLASGGALTVALRADGTVAFASEYEQNGYEAMSEWRDIVQVEGGPGCYIGLKADGTLVTVGDRTASRWEAGYMERMEMIIDVSGWKDITAVCGGNSTHVVGLKADGTVVAEGFNNMGQCDVSDWKDIVSVCAGENVTFGVKADGTVVVAGQTEYDTWDRNIYVSGWTDIVALSYSGYHLVGLKSDGTVVATGNNYANQCSVDSWENIVAVVADTGYQPDMGFTLGLKADGTVVLVGDTRDGHYRFTTLQNVAVPK